MASSYTVLGTEKMTTGENAGTWGTTTNTNLVILEQALGGYLAKSIAGSAQTTTLAITDGDSTASTSEARHHVIKLTGSITGNQVVTVPNDVVKSYVVSNATSGAYTVVFQTVSGSGFTFATTNKGVKLLFADGTNVVDTGIGSVGTYDLDGAELTLDADSDTSITASTDDQIDFEIAGADDFTMTANAFNVLTGSHATFADSANAKFGTGNDMLMYHDGSNSYITNAQGALKVATETSGIAVTIGHTTSETTVADNLTVTGTLTGTLATAAQGTVTSLGTLTTLTVDNVITNGTTIGHTDDTDLMTLADGVLTVAGELDAATLDISGNADIDGTTNLDAVDIDGAVQIDAAFTSGVDGQGYDTKFFGDTSSAYMLWDTSADDLVLAGAAGIDLAGDIDVDGTANLDAVDIDGAVQIDGATTVGVDGTGLDVKFFGDTAGSFLLWDQSADALLLTDSTPIQIGDTQDLTLYHDGTNSYITNAVGALKIATETSGIALTIGHTTSETTVADNLTVTGDFNAGNFKAGGTNFTGSLLVGHSTSGTLDAATYNTGVGIAALDALTAGDHNTAVGGDAGTGITTGTKNTFIGFGSGRTGAANFGNVGVGYYSLYGANDGGFYNTAIGYYSGVNINSGHYNVLLGFQAGDNITTGSGNVVIGKADVSSATADDQLSIADGEDGSVVWMTGDNAAKLTFPGALQVSGAVTVGVDDTGLDVQFFGASAGAYALWDQSADLLDIRGATAAGAGLLRLTTGELTVVDADKLGRIDFQAPLEASGTDAILIGASIWAEADDTFAAGVNNTDLVFALGKSEAAAEKFRFTADNEIGVAGANYGTDGQVLTSGGAGAAVAWEDSATGAVTALNNATQSELVTVGSTTTELDAEANLTFTGSALTCIGTITTGVDNTGHDVKFFGATSGSFLLWDESDDALELTDSSPIKIGDGGDMTIYHDGTDSFVTNSQGGLKLATETSGIAVTIGHTTSETTVADNLTITGTTVGTTFDLNGTADGLILDANGNTTISSPTDDQIDFEIAGADDFTMTANTFTILSGSTIAIAAGGAITNAGTMAPDITSTGKALVFGF